jgi:hypothetical protein
MRKIILFDFVGRPRYKIIKSQCFERVILLFPSGKQEEEDRKPICWPPLAEAASLSGLELFIDNGQRAKEQFYTL